MEEIMGLSPAGRAVGVGSGMDALLGSRIATPGLRVWCGPLPHGFGPGPWCLAARSVGAWWFENWIVDASKKVSFDSFLVVDFVSNSKFFLLFVSIVL
ncbi:hypothetical protein [Bifidobacterium callitrichidarum]|uniref:hypothetical protein n=1 Tax=Bifidobacterium callitrichidarum TaxID=2052941 RepID=UPI0014736114|nr:hypothetical protein [Bifidobacterium callitrichidarum]